MVAMAKNRETAMKLPFPFLQKEIIILDDNASLILPYYNPHIESHSMYYEFGINK